MRNKGQLARKLSPPSLLPQLKKEREVATVYRVSAGGLSFHERITERIISGFNNPRVLCFDVQFGYLG